MTAPVAPSPVPQIAGRYVLPGEEGWDVARSPWIVNVDQRPVAVAYPVSTQDVVTLVGFAREHGLRIAVQGTGHNAAPRAAMDDAILVRMDEIRGTEVDPVAKTATVRAGTLAGDVQAAASPHGLAPLSGSSPDVSVAGYTLGGGLGWLGRKHGLCCDSIVSAEVVLADGSVVRTDAENEPELFWALRGGGGSFGIVTELTLRLFDVEAVTAGWLAWPWERAREIVHAWHAWQATTPDEVTTALRIMQLPPLPVLPEPLRGAKLVVVDGAVLTDDATAAELLAPLRALDPAIDTFASVTPGDLIRIHGDPEEPMPGMSTSTVLKGTSTEVLDALVDVAGHESGSPLLFVELRQLGGALTPTAERGALGGIDGDYVMFSFGLPMDPAMAAGIAAHLAVVEAAVAPAANGQYLNFAERPIDCATAFAPERYARLQALRSTVDPDGMLLPNHEIPAV